MSALIGQVFRACAIALFAPGDRSAAQLASSAAQAAALLAPHGAGKAVADLAAFAARVSVYNYADAMAPIRAATSAAAYNGSEAEASLWTEIDADIETATNLASSNLEHLALWLSGVPEWVRTAWLVLRLGLPRNEDWDVWFDWYEQRLRGGSRGKEYELVFASVPQAEWDNGPAAANAWIKAHLPPAPTRDVGKTTPQIRSPGALRDWLEGQPAQASIAIAVRSALRVLPLTIRQAQFESSTSVPHQLSALAGLMFRWTALAVGMARYPARYRAIQPDPEPIAVVEVSAGPAARAAAHAAASANPANLGDPRGAAAHAGYSAEAAAEVAFAADESLMTWSEVDFDTARVAEFGAARIAEELLWSSACPLWASDAWVDFQAALPEGEDWDVWIDWYEERLRGGSRGEAYELVFASVPQEVWDKGPAAANAWIKAHLPKAPEADAAGRASRAAAEPRRALRLWLDRVAARRGRRRRAEPAVLSALFQRGGPSARAGGLPGRRRAAAEGVARRTLQRAAGIWRGARILSRRPAEDGGRGQHSARQRSGPHPARDVSRRRRHAARGLRQPAEKRDRQPVRAERLLRPRAAAQRGGQRRELVAAVPARRGQGLFRRGRGQHAALVRAARSSRGCARSSRPSRPPPRRPSRRPPSAIEPPPLPPGTPDAQNSWKRQMATAANALWETFLQGRDMPVAQDEWRAAADELGAHVRPILEFLRAQEEGK